MQGVDLTPLNTVADHLVLLLQALGVVMLVVGFCILGLMKLASFGNEHQSALIKTVAFDLIIGFIILLGAPTISHIIQGAFSFLVSTQGTTK